MTFPATLRSLRTELLVKLALLLSAALLLPVPWLTSPRFHVSDPLAIGLIIGGDIALFVACAALVLHRTVVRPLREVALAAQDIAAGDLQRRMPATSTHELHDVAATFDRLTERVREDQAQLIRAEKLASIGRLAASVAHEIGNPLGAIFGHVHLLRQKMQADPQAGEGLDMLGVLERESARIERIVRGLLDYARARPPAPVPVDVDGVVRSCVDLLRSQGALDTIDVDLELTDAPLFVSGQR